MIAATFIWDNSREHHTTNHKLCANIATVTEEIPIS